MATTVAMPPTIEKAFKSQYQLKHGFKDQEHLVNAILEYLITREQVTVLTKLKLTLPAVLGGRFSESDKPFVNKILKDWNKQLGSNYFETF